MDDVSLVVLHFCPLTHPPCQSVLLVVLQGCPGSFPGELAWHVPVQVPSFLQGDEVSAFVSQMTDVVPQFPTTPFGSDGFVVHALPITVSVPVVETIHVPAH